MRRTTVISAITLVLCFLVGYATYQAADFVKDLISDRLFGCHSETERGCQQQNTHYSERERPRK